MIDCLDTTDNPYGLCDLVQQTVDDKTISVLATLDLEDGYFRLRKLVDGSKEYVVPAHPE